MFRTVAMLTNKEKQMNTSTSVIEENFRNKDHIYTTADFTSSEAVVNALGFSDPSASHQYEFNAELIMIYELNVCHPLNEQSFDHDIDYINEVYDSFIREINGSDENERDKVIIEIMKGRGFKFYMKNDYDSDYKETWRMNMWLVEEIKAGTMTVEYAINHYNFLPNDSTKNRS